MSHKEYSKFWMRDKRDSTKEERRKASLLAEGKCPKCEVILKLFPSHNCDSYDWLVLGE